MCCSGVHANVSSTLALAERAAEFAPTLVVRIFKVVLVIKNTCATQLRPVLVGRFMDIFTITFSPLMTKPKKEECYIYQPDVSTCIVLYRTNL